MVEIKESHKPQHNSENRCVTSKYSPSRFSVAPMLDWTDRHCRYFHRQLSQHALLYTEMVTTGAILHGKADYLAYHQTEQPLALQLGGSSPDALANCAKIAEKRGYNEINLNVGCPSNRVQNGRFGACLMAEAGLVARCVDAMRQQVSIPITVKTRIGIDNQDSYEFLSDFIDMVANHGHCDTFVIHARKAWLSGLSPKENREKPPLDYLRVYKLKQDFPQLTIILNGGITNLKACEQHLMHLDGVMLGRAAYQNPGLLAEVDNRLFGCIAGTTNLLQVVQAMYPYIEKQLSTGIWLGHITRHMLGLFQGVPGARQWRRYLSENSHKPGAGVEVLDAALAKVADNYQLLKQPFDSAKSLY